MEKVASQVSETAIQSQENHDDEGKKVEFNVNAKEFIPVMFDDGLEKPESWNLDQPVNQKTTINKKIGDNYKPMFMEGMTEKFIEGPYVGNGKDPEIPFVRYYSKGQAIDFFNKKYFCAEPSGEISFRNGGEAGEQEDLPPPQQQQQQKPYYDSTYIQSNIFRPPFVDLLVQDILYWQYLAASRNKTVSRRPSGKQSTFSRRKEGTCKTEEIWEESGGDQLQFQSSPEQQKDCSSNAKEQRPARAHRRMNFTNSNLSPNHNSKEFKPKYAQNKLDDSFEKKNDVVANDLHEPSKINTDELEGLKDHHRDEAELQNHHLKSVDNLSIAVNITIDSPTDYTDTERATGIAKSVSDRGASAANTE